MQPEIVSEPMSMRAILSVPASGTALARRGARAEHEGMIRKFLLALGLLACCAAASAQDCPGPMRLVLGLAPGGGTDAFARVMGQRLAARIGRPVVVENKGGAGGNIATTFVAKAPPDGCTLLVTGNWHNINLLVYAQPGYESKDFAPVIRAVDATTLLVANAQQPFRTLAGLVEYAKANPGKLSYGSSGTGSANHLTMELFLKSAGLDIVHVPYKGAAPSVADTVAGVVAVAVSGATAVQPHIASGRLRALAVTGPTRWPSMPDVPTLAEAGYREATSVVWTGFLAPAATPLAVREKLNAEFRAILAEPAIGEQLRGYGYFPTPGSVAEFDAFLRDDLRATQRVVKDLKLKPE